MVRSPLTIAALEANPHGPMLTVSDLMGITGWNRKYAMKVIDSGELTARQFVDRGMWWMERRDVLALFGRSAAHAS